MSRSTDPDNSLQYVVADDGLSRAQVVAGAEPTVVEATIADGQSLSAAVDLRDGTLVRLVIPSTWTTATSVTFQTSYDGATYSNLYSAAGSEYTVTVAASREIVIPIADFIGVRYLKVRSGTAASPQTQSGGDTLQLVLAP